MTMNRRMTITAAVGVVLTSTVLWPVFTDSTWFAASLGAVLVVALVGALTRLRTLPVLICLAAGVIGLLLYLNLVFEARHSLLLVIPTPTSVRRLADLFGTGLTDSRRYAPPVPNLPGLLFLTEAGVGITAVATDLIAVRLRSTALAGLPLLVLFTVPVMVNAPHSQLATLLVFCLAGAGYLAMLSADGRERIRVWGRLISLWRTGAPEAAADQAVAGASGTGASGTGASGTGVSGARVRGAGLGPDTRALAAAGRRVGLASIVLALCAPLLVPGLHPSKVFASGPGIGGTGGGGGGSLSLPSALSQTVKELQEKHPSLVFTYTTSASTSMEDADAQYFRQYVFDTLTDGGGWQVTHYDAGATPSTQIPEPQGLSNSAVPELVRTTVTMARGVLSAPPQPTFLPLVYPATQLQVKGKWLADQDLMVYSSSSSIAGQSYTEQSLNVDPTASQLQQLGKLTSAAGLATDLGVPAGYKIPALEQLAREHTSGQSTELGEINALADWLSGPQFSYSLAGPVFDNANGLLTFLTRSRSGYCVQYAYAMTVLVRLLGIPARLVVGYTAGTQVKGHDYQVMSTDAHAWTEVYFPTFGWLRFEPTPSGQGTAHATNYMDNTPGTGHASTGVPIITATAAPGPQSSTRANKLFGRGHTQQGATGPAINATGKAAGTPWAAIALAVIAAIALACAVIAMLAPPVQRTPAGPAISPGRRRRPVSAAAATLVAAALIALALYRLLSRTSGLRLSAGWATVGIVFGATAILALIAPSVIRLVLRRVRWMRAGDDMSRAHVAWREFRDDLTDFGVGGRASEPPRTLAGRVTAGLPEPAGEAIRRLALAEERATYAARASGSAQLRPDGVAARRGLAASAGRAARWRAWLFPASVVTALADTATRVPDLVTARLPRRRPQHRPAG